MQVLIWAVKMQSRKDPMQPCNILQDRRKSFWILQDPTQNPME